MTASTIMTSSLVLLFVDGFLASVSLVVDLDTPSSPTGLVFPCLPSRTSPMVSSTMSSSSFILFVVLFVLRGRGILLDRVAHVAGSDRLSSPIGSNGSAFATVLKKKTQVVWIRIATGLCDHSDTYARIRGQVEIILILIPIECTLQSIIIGKGLHETAPVGRGKLRHEIRVPISNNYARLSTCAMWSNPLTWPIIYPHQVK